MDTEICKYCQNGEVIVEKLNGYTGRIKIHKNLLNTQIKDDNYYGWASVLYHINYCPWCGRALKRK
ncbi:MAG: hypothetical protein J6572_10700 [Gilliamella sp.]|nr:hypothetical protein [Gilliamella sp.]